MKLIYEGKTKNVYELENGNVMLLFKDDHFQIRHQVFCVDCQKETRCTTSYDRKFH